MSFLSSTQVVIVSKQVSLSILGFFLHSISNTYSGLAETQTSEPSENTVDSPQSSPDWLSTAIIVGITIGIVTICIVGILFLNCNYFRKRTPIHNVRELQLQDYYPSPSLSPNKEIYMYVHNSNEMEVPDEENMSLVGI